MHCIVRPCHEVDSKALKMGRREAQIELVILVAKEDVSYVRLGTCYIASGPSGRCQLVLLFIAILYGSLRRANCGQVE